MGNKLFQAYAIVFSAFIIFLVQNIESGNYMSYLLALFIITSALYISLKKHLDNKLPEGLSITPDLFLTTSIILLIVSITDGLSSPFFFLLYFPLFLFAFIATSSSIWVYLLAIAFFFLPQVISQAQIDILIKYSSFLLVTPLAYFFSLEIERRKKLDEKIEAKTEDIIQGAEALKDSSDNPEEIEALETIIEEAQAVQEDINPSNEK